MSDSFLKVSYSVLQTEEITHQEITYKFKLPQKIIYCYLLSLSATCKEVRPSLNGMATTLGIGDEQAVRRGIKELVKMGLISKIDRTGTTNLYLVHHIDNTPIKAPVVPAEPVFKEDDALPPFFESEPLEEPTETVRISENPIKEIAQKIYRNIHNRKTDENFSDYVLRNLKLLFPDENIHRLHPAITKHIQSDNRQFIEEFDSPF